MVSKLNCGITGSSGVLGSAFISKKFFNFIKFKGNITNKNAVNRWICKYQFDLIIHLAAVVPTNIVQKNYKKALKVNFNGTKYLINSIIKNNKNLKWFFFCQLRTYTHFLKKKLKKRT